MSALWLCLRLCQFKVSSDTLALRVDLGSKVDLGSRLCFGSRVDLGSIHIIKWVEVLLFQTTFYYLKREYQQCLLLFTGAFLYINSYLVQVTFYFKWTLTWQPSEKTSRKRTVVRWMGREDRKKIRKKTFVYFLWDNFVLYLRLHT